MTSPETPRLTKEERQELMAFALHGMNVTYRDKCLVRALSDLAAVEAERDELLAVMERSSKYLASVEAERDDLRSLICAFCADNYPMADNKCHNVPTAIDPSGIVPCKVRAALRPA